MNLNMRSVFFHWSILLIACAPAWSQTKNSKARISDKDACLAIVGYFDKLPAVKAVKVELFLGSELIDSVKTKTNRDFRFVLLRNKRYSLHITAPGYYSRFLTINTDLADNINTNPLFVFEFDLQLIQEMQGVDDFYLDFPIASISFDQKLKAFNFSKKYTEAMQKEVKKAETQNGR